ncbi:putative 2-dehydropantoate 2-reductase family protein [Alternaria rosae]|uniref:putative 2-dehydropantoate 2-reductase family protein n=1 Tax=Alternaria rosae TaxID=1187941 RepID=UPI001E8E5C05|nr:putative 2-dehydropantoate 2-reductase family protein [Alternaria rosae]KAH6873272.1 putative 2-dehydropantoate 2-reductase family protein [Alternaria rosae]
MAICQRLNSAIGVPRAGHVLQSRRREACHFPAGTFRSWRLASEEPGHHRSISSTRASPRIHVLGLGSIGTFTAHSLADIPARPAVNLLLHRSSLMNEYLRTRKRLLLQTREGQQIAQTGYGVEVLNGKEWHTVQELRIVGNAEALQLPGPPTDEIINDLIVCVKSTQTVAALQPLLPRLSRTSNVTFLQNGAGMIEDANMFLWPDPHTRPNYITGVISHGITLNGPFNVTHTGPAATSVGPVPREDGDISQTPSPLLEILPLAPRLNCRAYPWPTILQIQLEKLACNALSNPICALEDAVTAYILSIPETNKRLMQEISSVILALPELQGVEGVKERFSAKALHATVMDIIEKNRATTVSMVWDMRHRRETEIRYINGYWARRGREVGARTPLNDELVERVQAMTKDRLRETRS